MKYLRMFLVLSLTLFLLSACIGPERQRESIAYYTLDYEPPVFDGLDQLPFSIKLKRFSISPLYNSSQIIYSDSRFKRDPYVYHRWRSNPRDTATYMIARDMSRSGIFAAVGGPESHLSHSHTLEGSVDEFVEVDNESEWKARLSITITLLKKDEPDISRRVLMTRNYSTSCKLRRKHPGALAEAMSEAMSRLSGRMIRGIHDALLKSL